MINKKNFSEWFSRIPNSLGILILKGLSWLPFPIIYGLSDVFAFLLQYIIKYRKNVIHTNLCNAFPEKSEKEISAIGRKFYRHFADITFETLKGYSMSWKSITQRITFLGTEEMDAWFEKGASILLLCMHYNNWEWSGTSQKVLKHQYLLIYNPLRNNPQFEKYLMYIRERWGVKSVPVHKSARAAMDFHNRQIPVVLALVADQRPATITPFWTTFMNQEACFYSGPEKIAKKTNQPVFFHHTRKIKRGHYEVSFIPLIENPAEMKEEDILLTYVRTMEKYIREEPAYYLWSHKRWKQKRPENLPLYL
jgi:Kdo2-lipid IVA lauroyltransferase/acyltransferase